MLLLRMFVNKYDENRCFCFHHKSFKDYFFKEKVNKTYNDKIRHEPVYNKLTIMESIHILNRQIKRLCSFILPRASILHWRFFPFCLNKEN